MWEASAPTAVETASVAFSQLQNIHVNLSSQIGFPSNQKFFMCHSGIKDGNVIFYRTLGLRVFQCEIVSKRLFCLTTKIGLTSSHLPSQVENFQMVNAEK